MGDQPEWAGRPSHAQDPRQKPAEVVELAPRNQVVDPTEEAELRRKSQVRSYGEAARFLFFGLLIGALFVFSVGVWRAADAQGCAFGLCIEKRYWVWLPVVVLAIVLCRHTLSYIYQRIQWAIAQEKAKQIAHVEPVVEGFTSLFRRYVATRAMGIRAFVWAAWGLFTCACFAMAWADSGASDVATYLPFALPIMLVLSLGELVLAFLISVGFKIGLVLVDFLSIIAYRSANPFDTQNADDETRDLAVEQRRKHYWWFY